MKICEDYALLLDQFLDGELNRDDEALVREHLVSCPACAAYVADAMAVRAAFGDLDEIDVPEGLSDGVMAVIRAHAAPRKKNYRWMKAAASLAACAAIVFAAVRVMPFGASSGASAAASAPAITGWKGRRRCASCMSAHLTRRRPAAALPGRPPAVTRYGS